MKCKQKSSARITTKGDFVTAGNVSGRCNVRTNGPITAACSVTKVCVGNGKFHY